MWWRRFNAGGAAVSAVVWAFAEVFGWVDSIALVSRISFLTQIVAFIAAYRADSPSPAYNDRHPDEARQG